MKSTDTIHKIVDTMPIEDRKAMMVELLDLRITILEEISAAVNNSKKLLRLFYTAKK